MRTENHDSVSGSVAATALAPPARNAARFSSYPGLAFKVMKFARLILPFGAIVIAFLLQVKQRLSLASPDRAMQKCTSTDPILTTSEVE